MSTESDAICFHEKDYASTPRRIGAALTDFIVLFLLLMAVGLTAQLASVPREVLRMPVDTKEQKNEKQKLINEHMRPIQVPAFGGFLAAAALYHVGLRRLRGGTLGYRLMGLRLVDATGRPPEWRTLVKRFWLAVPFVMLVGASYLLCRQNPRKQSFHDQWSGTWVVRKSARPDGPAHIIYQSKLLGTFPLTYIDLEPIEPAAAPPPEVAAHA